MGRFLYPKEMLPVVMELKEIYSNAEMAEIINKQFGLNMDAMKIKQYMSNRKISRINRPKNLYPERCVFTEEQQAFIKANYKGCGPKEMTDKINKEFGTSFKRMQIKGYYRTRGYNSGLTGHFEKGHEPWCKGMKGKMPPTKYNSGRFKKGNVSANKKEVGTVAKRNDGYWIKIKDPRTWRQYHRVIYEQIYGEVPKNMNVDFKDGDRFNINPNNLILVSKSEHCSLNTRKYRSSNPEITEVGLKIIQLENLVNDKKGKKDGSRRRIKENQNEAEVKLG